MAGSPTLRLFGFVFVMSACSTDDVAPVPAKPKQPPALACAEQPLELPRPPTGGLPCDLMPPTLQH